MAPWEAHPPALETAAASSGPEAWFMPARMMGCLMPSSFVMGVWIVWCAIGGRCDAEQCAGRSSSDVVVEVADLGC